MLNGTGAAVQAAKGPPEMLVRRQVSRRPGQCLAWKCLVLSQRHLFESEYGASNEHALRSRPTAAERSATRAVGRAEYQVLRVFLTA